MNDIEIYASIRVPWLRDAIAYKQTFTGQMVDGLRVRRKEIDKYPFVSEEDNFQVNRRDRFVHEIAVQIARALTNSLEQEESKHENIQEEPYRLSYQNLRIDGNTPLWMQNSSVRASTVS